MDKAVLWQLAHMPHNGIYLALTNSLPDANTYLSAVLQSDKNNKDARQALAIMTDAQRLTP